jgi:hypothetical protein
MVYTHSKIKDDNQEEKKAWKANVVEQDAKDQIK